MITLEENIFAAYRLINSLGWASTEASAVRLMDGRPGERIMVAPHGHNLDGIKPVSLDELIDAVEQKFGSSALVCEPHNKYALEIKIVVIYITEKK